MPADAISKYIAIFLLGFFCTTFSAPVFAKIARVIGMVDLPDARRVHRHPTPKGGGLALYLAVHLIFAAIFLSSWHTESYLGNGIIDFNWWLVFLLTSTILLLVGIADDIVSLKAWQKLSGQVLVGVIMFYANVRVGGLLGLELPYLLDLLATLIWFVVIINAFNLIDGYDGLATGLAAIAALGLSGTFLFRHLPLETLVLVGFIGSCIGFLKHNIHPARMFLGDTGSMFLGFTLASFTLTTMSKGTLLASLWVPLLAFGIPVFDIFLAVWRRASRKALSYMLDNKYLGGVMTADLDHLHHRLMKVNSVPRNVTASLCLANSILVLIGLLALVNHDYVIGLFASSFVIICYIVIRHVAGIELWNSGLVIILSLKNRTRPMISLLIFIILDLLSFLLTLFIIGRISPQESLNPGLYIDTMISGSSLLLAALFLLVMSPYKSLWSGSSSSRKMHTSMLAASTAVLIITFLIYSYGYLSFAYSKQMLLLALFICFASAIRSLPDYLEVLMRKRSSYHNYNDNYSLRTEAVLPDIFTRSILNFHDKTTENSLLYQSR